MILAIHQPHFLPWPPYINRLSKVDIFLFQDDVQFRPRYYQNRCKIPTLDGGLRWVTVPVKSSRVTQIQHSIVVREMRWIRKFRASIEQLYGCDDSTAHTIDPLLKILHEGPADLASMNIALLLKILELIRLPTPMILRTSELPPPRVDMDSAIHYCEILNATSYIYGVGGGQIRHPSNHMRDAGLRTFVDIPLSNQPAGLSVLHYLLCFGPIAARKLVLDSSQASEFYS